MTIEIIRFRDLVFRPPKRRGIQRIAISDNEIECRGEPLGQIWWRGTQWAVTSHGIECLDGTYFIEKTRLMEEADYEWPRHMDDKIWVDIDEFTTAWMIGLLLHGYRVNATQIRQIRRMFSKLRLHREPQDS